MQSSSAGLAGWEPMLAMSFAIKSTSQSQDTVCKQIVWMVASKSWQTHHCLKFSQSESAESVLKHHMDKMARPYDKL